MIENKMDDNNNMKYKIMINDQILYEGVNTSPESWKNVAVWISDNFYLAANANARNIALTTCDLKYKIKQTGIEIIGIFNFLGGLFQSNEGNFTEAKMDLWSLQSWFVLSFDSQALIG